MKTLPQYDRFRIYDAISRLELVRCSIGWGQLNDDLEVAIDCLQHVVSALEEHDNMSFDDLTAEINKIVSDNG